MSSVPYPRTLTHVGVTVPDIEAAFDWYESVLGFERVMEPMTVEPNEGGIWDGCVRTCSAASSG